MSIRDQLFAEINAPEMNEQPQVGMDTQLGNQVVTALYDASKAVKNHHWNYVDYDYFPYHPELDDIYEYLLDAADTVAERIRRFRVPVNPVAHPYSFQVVGLVGHLQTQAFVTSMLADIIQGVVELRATLDESQTGIQSAFDQIIDDGQQLLWKWSSSTELIIARRR